MAKKKEKGTKKPELQQIIDRLELYKEELFENPKISKTRFAHMQNALHWTKQHIRTLYGAPLERNAKAWIK